MNITQRDCDEIEFYPQSHETVRKIVYDINSYCNISEIELMTLIDAINKGCITNLKITTEK